MLARDVKGLSYVTLLVHHSRVKKKKMSMEMFSFFCFLFFFFLRGLRSTNREFNLLSHGLRNNHTGCEVSAELYDGKGETLREEKNDSEIDLLRHVNMAFFDITNEIRLVVI